MSGTASLSRAALLGGAFQRSLLIALMTLPMTGHAYADDGPQDRTRPNILFIMSDDHASQAVSCYGHELARVAPTPHIDRIAREGMRLDNVYCTNSLCTPSRACILTGKFSHVNGVKVLHSRFNSAQPTYASILQKHGYRTALVGKWHLRTEPKGFDYYKILIKQGVYFDAPFLVNSMSRREVSKGYVTDVITDDTIKFIRANRDKPFCVMCQHKAPHRPCEPHPKYKSLLQNVDLPEPATLYDDLASRSNAMKRAGLQVTKLKRADFKIDRPSGLSGKALVQWSYQTYFKEYLRTIASVDESVGRLLKCLDETGLAENTVVVYTSDQGFFVGEHGFYDKRFMYEESIRMPFVIRYPKAIRPGSTSNDICMNVDFAPTFLDYCGVPIPKDMQGTSMRPVLEGRTPSDWQDAAYYHLFDGGYGVPQHYGIRTKTHKLIHYYKQDEWELYDLASDPNEVNNLYGRDEFASITKDLKKRTAAFQHRIGYDHQLRASMNGTVETPANREHSNRGGRKKR